MAQVGRTPLHTACSQCHVEVVSILVQHGVDLSTRDMVSSVSCSWDWLWISLGWRNPTSLCLWSRLLCISFIPFAIWRWYFCSRSSSCHQSDDLKHYRRTVHHSTLHAVKVISKLRLCSCDVVPISQLKIRSVVVVDDDDDETDVSLSAVWIDTSPLR
jgi:hypothetical protein